MSSLSGELSQRAQPDRKKAGTLKSLDSRSDGSIGVGLPASDTGLSGKIWSHYIQGEVPPELGVVEKVPYKPDHSHLRNQLISVPQILTNLVFIGMNFTSSYKLLADSHIFLHFILFI